MSIGLVMGIYIAPAAGAPMQDVGEAIVVAGEGIQGDRYGAGLGSFNKGKPGQRQVTLINERFFSGSGFSPIESRRNFLVRDVELMWLIGREFQIGSARFRGVKYCDPCPRPSTLAGKGPGFKEAFLDCGGLVAEVTVSGIITLYSQIIPPPKGY